MLSTPGRPFDNTCARCPNCPRLTFANDQAERLQDAPELVIDPDAHIVQLVPDDQQRLTLVRGEALHLHGFEPADTDRFGKSPRSVLLGRTDNTAWACRASRQTTGKPSAVRAWVSQTNVGPLSRPTRTRSGARFLISLTMAAGSDATLPSKTRVPFRSRMQTLVSLSDTSIQQTFPWPLSLRSRPSPVLPIEGEPPRLGHVKPAGEGMLWQLAPKARGLGYEVRVE
jgi:hypothetical protein